MTCLTKHGIKKNHSEFSEIFSATYRGAAFALVCSTIRSHVPSLKVLLAAERDTYPSRQYEGRRQAPRDPCSDIRQRDRREPRRGEMKPCYKGERNGITYECIQTTQMMAGTI